MPYFRNLREMTIRLSKSYLSLKQTFANISEAKSNDGKMCREKLFRMLVLTT